MVAGTTYIDTATGELRYLGAASAVPGVLCDTNGQVPLIPLQESFSLTNGIQSIGGPSGNIFTSKGTRSFDPSVLFSGNSKITRTLQLKALVQVTPGVTMQIRIYNTTDGAPVTSSLLTNLSSSLVEVSTSLTVGIDIPNSNKLYDVQMIIITPNPASALDQAICKSAEFVVRWS